MIPENELRIGNWFEFINEDVEDNRFGPLCSRHFHIAGEYGYRIEECINPIPLTPEILEKCGFEKWTKGETYEIKIKNGDNSFQIHNNDVFLGGYDSCTSGQGFTLRVEYLHQLQNLYFALTGEELKVHL